ALLEMRESPLTPSEQDEIRLRVRRMWVEWAQAWFRKDPERGALEMGILLEFFPGDSHAIEIRLVAQERFLPVRTDKLCKQKEHPRAYDQLQVPSFAASRMKETLERGVLRNWLDHAQECLDRKDFRRAAETTDQFLKRVPDHAPAQKIRDQATLTLKNITAMRDELLAKGLFADALRHVTDAWSQKSGPEQRTIIFRAWVAWAEARLKASDYAGAEAALDDLLRKEK